MRKLTAGQERELLQAAREKLKKDPTNPQLKRAVDKLEESLQGRKEHERGASA